MIAYEEIWKKGWAVNAKANLKIGRIGLRLHFLYSVRYGAGRVLYSGALPLHGPGGNILWVVPAPFLSGAWVGRGLRRVMGRGTGPDPERTLSPTDLVSSQLETRLSKKEH